MQCFDEILYQIFICCAFNLVRAFYFTFENGDILTLLKRHQTDIPYDSPTTVSTKSVITHDH